MRSAFNFKAAAIVSALFTLGFLVIAVAAFAASTSAFQETVGMLAFCAAGIGWLAVLVSAAAHSAFNR